MVCLCICIESTIFSIAYFHFLRKCVCTDRNVLLNGWTHAISFFFFHLWGKKLSNNAVKAKKAETRWIYVYIFMFKIVLILVKNFNKSQYVVAQWHGTCSLCIMWQHRYRNGFMVSISTKYGVNNAAERFEPNENRHLRCKQQKNEKKINK